MRTAAPFLLLLFASPAAAQVVQKDIAYGEHKLHKLDVYAPKDAKNLPVVFWIHGGGWQAGDKSDVQVKPEAFNAAGYVFVSINYRLLPEVNMTTLTQDVAKAAKWTADNIAKHGGDPKRLVVGGHSAGAQLAAYISIDDRWLKAEGLGLDIIKACIPVDGDTYDIPAIIEVAETRWRVHGFPPSKFGHREKFENDPAKHKDFSAVTHVAKGKHIPPFLILHVGEHPDTSAQARRLAKSLQDAEVPATVFSGRDTSHGKINADIGKPDTAETKAVFDFLAKLKI
jgi:acetyl esterase/lipase